MLSAEYHQRTTSLAHKRIVLNKTTVHHAVENCGQATAIVTMIATVKTPPPSRGQVQPHGCSPAAAPPKPTPDTGE